MASNLRLGDLETLLTNHWEILAFGAVTVYASLRYVYLAFFHPASRFPGPKLAAVSNLWYAYQWLTGRYPWAVQEALKKYGDVVRVAPNELVFITPQAASDIYTKHTKNQELFVKVDVAIGFGDDGITWEKDPAKHRKMAKDLSPSFSVKSLKALEPTMHKYIDTFVRKMKVIGSAEAGIELKTWTDWVAMDMAADLTSSRELNQMQDMKSAPLLTIFWAFNFFITVNQVFKKFPLMSPLKWGFLPFSVLFSRGQIERVNRETLEARIESRSQAQHLDHFEQLLPTKAPVPRVVKLFLSFFS